MGGDLAGRAGESAPGVLVFLAGTWGTTEMAARCPRWYLALCWLMFVFLSVSPSVRPRGPLKELQQLQEVLLGSKFK